MAALGEFQFVGGDLVERVRLDCRRVSLQDGVLILTPSTPGSDKLHVLPFLEVDLTDRQRHGTHSVREFGGKIAGVEAIGGAEALKFVRFHGLGIRVANHQLMLDGV